MLTFLEGHGEPVYTVAYSADGKFLGSGGFDRKVKIWDRATGQAIRTLGDHTDLVLAVALSRDGKQLATTGLDKTVLVYDFTVASTAPAADAAALAPRLKLAGHAQHVYGLDFSPDGARLASAGADQVVKLWNTADGANYANCAGHASQVYSVAFHPAGEQLASCGADKTVRLWQAADAKQTKELKDGIADGLYSVMWSPDGVKILAAGLAKTWLVWNAAEDKPSMSISGHTDYIYRAAYNPAGTRIATIGYTGTLHFSDAANGAGLHQEKLPVKSGYTLAWSPDNAQLAIAAADPRVLLYAVPDVAK